MLPERLALFCSLAAAVIVAAWTAARRGLLAWLLPLLAVASLVPAFWRADYLLKPMREGFFTAGLYKCIPRNDNVLIFPFGAWGNAMLWQAEADFWFRMPEGYLVPTPPADYLKGDAAARILTFTLGNPTIPQIISFVEDKKVDRVIRSRGTTIRSARPRCTASASSAAAATS